MRKLASIQKIAEIKPIENADNIEAVRVNGWWVVAKKDEFSINDLVVYFEIDSWIPNELAPFLSKGKEPRVFEGVKGERLRTVKLRGQISQGLILPISSVFPNDANDYDFITFSEGINLTDILGIKKWEAPIPAQLQGLMKGNFPSFIRKTDQERCQNLPEIFDDLDSEYELSVKLDGSSMTVYIKDGEIGICSRNLDLKVSEDNLENTFIKVAHEQGLIDSLKEYHEMTGGRNIAIQGELMGPGIQGNRENLKKHQFFLFDIWDIDSQEYFYKELKDSFISAFKVTSVPTIPNIGTHMESVASLRELNCTKLEDILAFVDKVKSLNHKIAEGVVFKRLDGKFSFKCISNKFLLKERD